MDLDICGQSAAILNITDSGETKNNDFTEGRGKMYPSTYNVSVVDHLGDHFVGKVGRGPFPGSKILDFSVSGGKLMKCCD